MPFTCTDASSLKQVSSAFRKLPSIYVFSYFPFGFAGRMLDLIVSVPDRCLSFYFSFIKIKSFCSNTSDNSFD